MSEAELVEADSDMPEEDEDEISPVINEAQKRMIQGETPERFIKKRQGPRGQMLDYVEVHYVRNQLNKAFGHNWDEEIVDKDIGDNHVLVHVRLRARTPKGEIIKDGFGSDSITRYKDKHPKAGQIIDIGNNLKSAVADGLKKAASKLGICEDVYWENKKHDLIPDEKDQTLETNTDLHRRLEAAISDFAEELDMDPARVRGQFKDLIWNQMNLDAEKTMKNLPKQVAESTVEQPDAAVARLKKWIHEGK